MRVIKIDHLVVFDINSFVVANNQFVFGEWSYSDCNEDVTLPLFHLFLQLSDVKVVATTTHYRELIVKPPN